MTVWLHARSLQAEPLFLGDPKPATAAGDIALMFQQAVPKTTAEHDPLLNNTRLHWVEVLDGGAEGNVLDGLPQWHPRRCTSVSVPGYDSWDGLYLECHVDWPLQLLFPPDVSEASCAHKLD